MHYPKKFAKPTKYSCLNASFKQDLPALSGNRHIQFLGSCFHAFDTTSDITQTFWRKMLYKKNLGCLISHGPSIKKAKEKEDSPRWLTDIFWKFVLV